MKNRIKLTLALSSAALLLGGLSSVSAASIGASFIGRDPGFSLAPTDTAGVVPQANWANLPSEDPYDGTSPTLKDSAGNFTATKVFWEANDSWRNDGPAPTTSDQRMMKGIIKANGVNSVVTFSITNLNAGTYNVIAYGVHNNGGDGSPTPQAKYTLGSTSYFMLQQNGFTNAYTQVTATAAPGAIGNYVRWDNVAAVNGGITLTMTKMDAVSDGVGMAGVQVIAVTGSFPPNAVAPAFSNANLPADTVAIEGAKATFTVAINGPWDVQWYKNDVLIPGATGLTYQTPALTVADNNATFKAVIINNVGQATSRSAKVEVDAATPPVLIQGFLKVEHYGSINGTAVTDLYNSDKYKNKTPDYVTYVAGCYSYPENVADNYGRVISGYVKLPAQSDTWTFFTRSDDASELYLNVDNTDPQTLPPMPVPGTDTPWAKETGCCNAFQAAGAAQTTAPYPLDGGIPYAIVAVVKEGGGGDYLYVAADAASVVPSSGTATINPLWCYVYTSTAGKRFSITQQPVAATVTEGRTATFTVAAQTSPEANAYGIIWQKNGVDIAGANGASYTTAPLALADGAKYRVKFLTLLGEKFSDEVQLTVVPDTTAPVIASAGASLRGGTGSNYDIGIIFDEAVKSGIDVPGNYNLSKGTISKVRYSQYANKNTPFSFGAAVSLEVTGITAGDSITVTANNIEDLKGNKGSSTKQVTVPATPLRWAIVGSQELVTNAATALTFLSDATVTASADGGADIDMLSGSAGHWANFDEQTFTYEEITGNFDRVVRVEYQDNSSQWARAGLAARAALDEGMNRATMATSVSKQVTIRVNPQFIWDGGAGNYSYEFAIRRDTGGSYASDWGGAGAPVVYPNAWIRMARADQTFTVSRSLDKGATWLNIGSYTFPATNTMPAKLLVGPFFAPELNNNGTIAGLGHSPLGRFRSYGDPAVIFAAPGQPEITGATIVGNQATIVWTGGGKLQQSSSLGATATWSDVPGQGTGTATVTIGTVGNMFFQVKK